ncbi:MAG: hypothetical protein WD751_05655 [Anaerolineales bacterium]
MSNYWKGKRQIKEFLAHPLILLFDCDTNKSDEDHPPFYKRQIPIQDENSIKKGIENLFSDSLIVRAEESTGRNFTIKSTPNNDDPEKQVWLVIEGEKKELADWICTNAVKEDFGKFSVVFDLINRVLAQTQKTY